MGLIKDSAVPLYRQLLNEIHSRIASGEWSTGLRIPTEAALADAFQVSRVTVRQALQAATEEGLIVRVPGKGTYISKAGNTHSRRGFIGYVVPHLSHSFNVQILLGVESILKTSGYQLIFCNSEGSVEEETRLLQGLADEGMAGYVVQPIFDENNNRQLLRTLARDQIPVIMIDRWLPDIEAEVVTTDHLGAGKAVVQHLIERGYTDIAYLARQPLRLASIEERWRGYEKAIAEAGLVGCSPVLVGGTTELGYIESPSTFVQRQHEAVATIAAYLASSSRPQAVVAMNDLCALLVLEAAKQVGIQIPTDLALVGFDDLDFAATLHPSLTTMRQQPFQIGVEAAKRLLARMHGRQGPVTHTRLPAYLMVRESSMGTIDQR